MVLGVSKNMREKFSGEKEKERLRVCKVLAQKWSKLEIAQEKIRKVVINN